MNETLLEQESIGLQSRLSLINAKLKPLDSQIGRASCRERV